MLILVDLGASWFGGVYFIVVRIPLNFVVGCGAVLLLVVGLVSLYGRQTTVAEKP